MREYFVVYDDNDNVVCYISNLLELSTFTGKPVRKLKYRFKNNDFISVIVDKTTFDVYKFC